MTKIKSYLQFLAIFCMFFLCNTERIAAQTALVKDIEPGAVGAMGSSYFVTMGAAAYFVAYTSTTNYELWKTDATTGGTTLVKDINAGTGNANPSSMFVNGTTLYFLADNGTNGKELWKSDGTTAGTVLVKDIATGTTQGVYNYTFFASIGATIYFIADDGTTGYELWKSDGTTAGTVLVKDIVAGAGSGFTNANYVATVGSALFFTANEGINGKELWKSDGTTAGTVLVKDIYAGASSSDPESFFVSGSTLFFTAITSANGRELWKSDGTTAGTVLVKDIYSGASSSNPSYFNILGSNLIFTATDGTNGTELWKSDGTTAGTVLIKDIYTGTSSGAPQNFINFSGALFFTAYTSAEGEEFWKTDGTTAGTVLVKDIYAGTTSSSASNFTVVGTKMYFSASTAANGNELWKTDGTTAGTVLVRDINLGGSSSPSNLANMNGTLYFQANLSVAGHYFGYEIFKSDGTNAGTLLVNEMNAIWDGTPHSFLYLNSTILFIASADTYGTELYKVTTGHHQKPYFMATDTTLISGGVNSYTTDFIDQTPNDPISWSWTFAGGTPSTSTLQNPTNIAYNTPGCYAVTLTTTFASGNGSTTKTCYINVTDINSAYCIPHTSNNTTNGTFISYVNLGTIDNPTSLANGPDYTNYTTLSTTLNQLGTYKIVLRGTKSTNSSYYYAYIDYNKDGVFGSSERIGNVFANGSFPSTYTDTITFTVPSGTYIGSTRLRIMIDGTLAMGHSSCHFAIDGEAEDYTVILAGPGGTPPVANFSASATTIVAGTSTNFTNLSTNNPTSWSWTFTGATPATSTLQNPSNITYPTAGCYQVSLVATNGAGSDIEVKTCYINVTPNSGTYCTIPTPAYGTMYGDFIDGVTLGSINNINTGSIAGSFYNDYTSMSTNLVKNTTYTINIKSGTWPVGYADRYAVWIDYNHDYDFTDLNEKLGEFLSTATSTTQGISFTVPSTAMTGNARMRVRGIWAPTSGVDPCALYDYGETEDYTVNITNGANAPIANFSASSTNITAGGSTNFTDLSTNNPTSWSWTFTGGTPSTSTAQNPSGISYATAGCYQVSLTATNASGFDAEVKTCYINVTAVGGVYCIIPSPAYGTLDGDFIDGVTLGTINNVNTGATTGSFYNDYTSMTTNLVKSTAYTINIKSGTWPTGYPDYYAVWIDYNHDSDFADANEKLGEFLSTAQLTTQSISFTVPSTATTGSTRMRVRGVWAAAAGIDPCALYDYGETEDYSVNIINGGIAPVANFSASATNITAGGSTNFTDLSTNNPTSWSWTFTGGTPSTSTAQSPSGITYASAGCYQVSLIATNASGSDTEVKTCYINVTATSGNYCVIPTSSFGTSQGDFIDGVSLGAINNINTGNVTGAFYNNYTSLTTNLLISNNYSIDIKSGTWLANYPDYYAVWIDYNQDDDFTDANEKLGEFLSTAQLTTQSIPFTVPSTATIGNTRMRIRGVWVQSPGIDPCILYDYGETEDYSVNITTATEVTAIVEPELNFEVYPNPNTGVFTVRVNFATAKNATVRLSNVLGQVLYEYNYSDASFTIPIDVQEQAGGVWFVTLKTDNQSITRKIIVAK